MNQIKTNLRMIAVLAFALSTVIGCNRQKSVATSNNTLSQSDKEKLNQVAKTIPPADTAKLMAQARRQPNIPQVNPMQDVQNSLRTVEEINRMNRINQQLRQNQAQTNVNPPSTENR